MYTKLVKNAQVPKGLKGYHEATKEVKDKTKIAKIKKVANRRRKALPT